MRVLNQLSLRLRDAARRWISAGPNAEARQRWLLAISQRTAHGLGAVSGNLTVLGILCGTDKAVGHSYTPIYEELLRPFRRRRIAMLEIGVGGHDRWMGGASLKMWAAFLRRASIVGIDIHDKTALSGGRVRVLQCSQVDRAGLEDIARTHGPFEVIIDDGSHVNSHQIESFRILYPHLRTGGYYFVEDVQTSYWPATGGGCLGDPRYERSCVHYFKSLVDSVNAAEFLQPAPRELGLDPTISSISFHHNLIVVRKDNALRRSNYDLADEELRASLLGPGR